MQIEVLLKTKAANDAWLGDVEVVVITLRSPFHIGTQAEGVGQFDGVSPGTVEPRPRECDYLARRRRRFVVLEHGHNRPCGMPAAYGGMCGGDDRQAVVILLTVDVAHETDERVGGTGVRLCRHGEGILDTPVVQRQVHPLVGSIQHEAVGVGRLQIRVAALVGVAIDIDRRAGQVSVRRALNVATV